MRDALDQLFPAQLQSVAGDRCLWDMDVSGERCGVGPPMRGGLGKGKAPNVLVLVCWSPEEAWHDAHGSTWYLLGERHPPARQIFGFASRWSILIYRPGSAGGPSAKSLKVRAGACYRHLMTCTEQREGRRPLTPKVSISGPSSELLLS